MPNKNGSFPSSDTFANPTELASWLEVWRQEFVFYHLNSEGTLTFVSDSVKDILGLEPSDMIGRNAHEYFDANHPLQNLLEDLAAQRSTSSGLQQRLCAVTKASGEIAFLGIRENIERNDDGMIVGRIGMACDMTEHVTTELSLHESEQKYRRLVEGLSGDNVIFTRDPEGEFTYVSPSVKRVLGYEPSTVLGLNWRDFVGEHFVGREEAERTDAKVAEGIYHQKLVVEISHAEGGTRLVEVQQHPIFSPDGEYISMEGIGKDVTESTRTSQELQRLKEDLEKRVADRTAELEKKNALLHESEARYRHVVEAQTEFVIRWLPDWTCSFVNGAYGRYFSSQNEALLGNSFLSTLHTDDRPRLRQVVASLTPEQPIGSIECRVNRPQDSTGWTQWTIRALFGSEGHIEEYQAVGRDITELKNAADTIREKEVHLAHVSRLATMGELVAGIAHEVHQPLHAAKTFAEAARRNLEAGLPNSIATAIDCTREISEAISRTAKIIRHIRAFTTSKPAKLEMLDVNCIVQEAAEIIAFETRRAHAEIRFDLAEELGQIQGDRIQLEQLCINLLMNAYEAMANTPSDSRIVEVRTWSDENQVMISFSDVGSGIDDESKDRLFDAFYTTKQQGMGMGLSLCKSIAEYHSGQLQAKPNSGHGATFVLSLPLSASPSCRPNL